MLENITEEQVEEYREAFALFDKDGDGAINNKVPATAPRNSKQSSDLWAITPQKISSTFS